MKAMHLKIYLVQQTYCPAWEVSAVVLILGVTPNCHKIHFRDPEMMNKVESFFFFF